ncbi:ABC transporter ATP-binding protein [Nocardioides sp. LHG3406-4]|uniref:ABC transporter ATP-binding protein n=1 Tax=Nocardioides sp. LHG3406-4 TaxID=2804575 RepID=UPI003CF33036
MSTSLSSDSTRRQAGTGRDADRVLDVRGLAINTPDLSLVRDVSFAVNRGERVALIGESGSGKSLTSLALMGLLPEGLTSTGSAELSDAGVDLLDVSEKKLASLRGDRISMVFQEPLTALNPTQKIGKQVAEVLRLHQRSMSRRDARAETVRMLGEVRLPDPTRAADAYPHQLSGGQRQRVVLAIAMANRPSLLICDEPTTALDVTVQAQVLDLITAEVVAQDSGLLFITHDLAVVSGICDRVLVMYGGTIVEAGTIEDVFTRPQHPYTLGLLECSDLSDSVDSPVLSTIPGNVPAAGQFPAGCVYRNRCPRETERCLEMPPRAITMGREVACWHPTDREGAN